MQHSRLIGGTAMAGILAVALAGYMTGFDSITPQTSSGQPQKEVKLAQGKAEVASDMAVASAQTAAPPSEALMAPFADTAQSMVTTHDAVTSNRSAAAYDNSGIAAGASMEMSKSIVAPYPYPYPVPDMPVIQPADNDRFAEATPNSVLKVSEQPVSTFSIDVDTASYAFVRRQLNIGVLPSPDAVRIEEMVNYFDYDYPLPEDARTPFKPSVTVYPTPWNTHTKLLHIGIQGHDVVPAHKPRSNLVFLVDVSGSMSSPDKLPLLQNALRMLVGTLKPEDTVAIVTYAGGVGTALEPTPVKDKEKIFAALANLQAGGGTAGAAGITQAYALARQHYDPKGVNRVMLATDGDFNIGISDPEALKATIERERESGIFLSVLGFGQGNYNDALMQALAQHGNGNAAYIDTLSEARKVLVDEASSTLFPIAKDVKIQIEFNPATVSEYRLIGYETRMLAREDFNNDKVDAGDIGSGHSVTALYEITPKGSPAQAIDDLRYGAKEGAPSNAGNAGNEYAFLKLRYKLPDQSSSKLMELPITPALEVFDIAKASEDVRFATSVAAFGQLLKGEARLGDYTYAQAKALASGARGSDPFGYRSEFITLVGLAEALRSAPQGRVGISDPVVEHGNGTWR